MCGVHDLSSAEGQGERCLDSDASVQEEEMGGVKSNSTLGSSLLEWAANNELVEFKKAVVGKGADANAWGRWYCRQFTTNKMGWCERTPAMIACLYGSVEVLDFILDGTCEDGGWGYIINKACGMDRATALHCAAASGSPRAVDIVRLLLSKGADPTLVDACGRSASEVIMAPPRLPHLRATLESLLVARPDGKLSLPPSRGASDSDADDVLPGSLMDDFDDLMVFSYGAEVFDPPSLSSSLGSSSSSLLSSSPGSSPSRLKSFHDAAAEKTRGYPVDPSLPDIKNSVFTSDEFRMFSFKIRPCSRAYSHDWTECPFVHPGENARRRDPRRFHYSCVPCPEFRKGACSRGDACEYAHGVFESWLHPAQYRTRLCKDGTSCARRVCFFAHTKEELRPLYISTGSAVSSPNSLPPLDIAMNTSVGSGSPSGMLMGPPFSPMGAPQSGLSSPMSPSSAKPSFAGSWTQPNVPALRLPSGGSHSSRLRAALNARNILLDELSMGSDFEGQLMNEIAALSAQSHLNAVLVASACGTPMSAKAAKYMNTNVAPINLEDLFTSEVAVASPRTPSHAQLSSQMHSPRPVRMAPQPAGEVRPGGHVFSPRRPSFSNSFGQPALFSTGMGSPAMDKKALLSAGIGTPAMERARLSPVTQRNVRKSMSREMGPGYGMADWGSPTGKPEWGVHGDDLSKLRSSASFKARAREEQDMSWVHKLVKDGGGPADSGPSPQNGCSVVEMGCNGPRDAQAFDSVLGSWIEQMQLSEIAA